MLLQWAEAAVQPIGGFRHHGNCAALEFAWAAVMVVLVVAQVPDYVGMVSLSAELLLEAPSCVMYGAADGHAGKHGWQRRICCVPSWPSIHVR